MKRLRVLNNEAGYFKAIFFLALIAFLIYAGLQFAMPLYKHSAFKTEAREIAIISLSETEQAKARILEEARELKLPIDEHDIEVTKSGRGIRVKAAWSDTVYLFGQDVHTFSFKIDIEG